MLVTDRAPSSTLRAKHGRGSSKTLAKNKMPFCLPKSVTVRLKNTDGTSLCLPNVILKIQTFASRKNDISLFPFATDKDGIAFITNDEMKAEVSATYDSGLMDYSSIESAHDMAEIHICTVSEIERAIQSRTKAWTSLLSGEEKRWKSISELIVLLKSATNRNLDIHDDIGMRPRIRDSWITPDSDYIYDIRIRKNGG
jgi:hypothetical protein